MASDFARVVAAPGLAALATGPAGSCEIASAPAASRVAAAAVVFLGDVVAVKGARRSLAVEDCVIRHCVVEQRVGDAAELPGVAVGAGAPPGDFVAEVRAAEDGVHEDAQPRAFGVVAVQVDAAGGLEDAAHFDESLPHEGEVGLSARADHFAGGGDHVADGFAVFKQPLQHCLIEVVEGEGVFEGALAGGGDQLFELLVGQVGVVCGRDAGGAGVFGADGPLVFAAAVEGGVEVDEVDGFAVDAFEAGQVVADVDGAVAEIHGASVGRGGCGSLL